MHSRGSGRIGSSGVMAPASIVVVVVAQPTTPITQRSDPAAGAGAVAAIDQPQY